ncbi:MAG: hypothetical protein MJE12_19810, partial [Alphaproteobacteria bacterium]|nr:hypothetical protein [Alphaproteobacteria bacterium]
EEYETVGERLGPPPMFNLPAGGLSVHGLTIADMARVGCRILVDPTNPFIAAYKAWKACYESMAAGGMQNPGFDGAEAEEIERDMFETIGLQRLLDIEKRTVER